MINIMSHKFFDLIQDIPHKSRRFNQQELLFERDDPVRYLYRLDQGEVHLLRRQIDGAAFILQRAGPGSIIAEASMMSKTYHCAAVAITAAIVTYWPRSQVRDRIGTDSRLAEEYSAHLAREVRTARLRAEIASLRRISDRLDAWLVWNDAILPAKGQWIRVAHEINVSPEALYRELAKRRKSGEMSGIICQ